VSEIKEFLREAAHLRHQVLVLATTTPANISALSARMETHREIVDNFYGAKSGSSNSSNSNPPASGNYGSSYKGSF
jgi:hypothetical protein